MKKYFKPEIDLKELTLNKNIASLSEWLQSNGLTDAGITTYVINS